MTTMTIARPAESTNFSRLLRTIGARLRRALELSAAPYMDGPMPPL